MKTILPKPVESRVQLKWTGVCPGVQRKHPSHYLQSVDGAIWFYPNNNKPIQIGVFHFVLAQTMRAAAAKIPLVAVFSDKYESINMLFSTYENGLFRRDLDIEPCQTLMVLDKLKVAPRYNHDNFLRECIEELITVFSWTDVIAVNLKNAANLQDVLTEMEFAKVSETPFAIRDNCRYNLNHASIPRYGLGLS